MKETPGPTHGQGREGRGKETKSEMLAKTDFIYRFVFQLDPYSSPARNWTNVNFLNILENFFFSWEQL